MSEFVYLYRGGMTNQSPEARQQNIQRWMAWFKELGDKGHVKNVGQPLDRTGKVVKGEKRVVTDGPYPESKDLVGGYMLVEARDLAHAAELSSGCPIFEFGGLVEVRPVMKIDM